MHQQRHIIAFAIVRDEDHALPGRLGGDEGFELGEGLGDTRHTLRLDIGVRNSGQVGDEVADLNDPSLRSGSPRSREPDVRVDERAERGARPGGYGGHVDHTAPGGVKTG